MAKKQPAERRPLDAYDTPAWAIKRFLEAYEIPRHGIFIEPACGSGRIVNVINEEYSDADWHSTKRWVKSDIAPRCVGALTRDWVDKSKVSNLQNVSLCISNPPYSIAQEFIESSFLQCPNAEIVMLLRIGFLSSAGRVDFFKEYGSPDVYVLPNRPSFTGGGTDKSDYGWFVWPTNTREAGTIRFLANTPIGERVAEAEARP